MHQFANFDPTPAILLASLCMALALVGVVRLANALQQLDGAYHQCRLYQFYHETLPGRNWLIDMDRDMSKDADLQWQRYVREVQAQQANLRG